MQRFIGLIILLAAGIGAYFCITNALWQHRANRDFVPVPAQILDTHVGVHHGSKGSVSYSPEASYSYTYEGRQYQSSDVLAISSSASRSWAEGVLARIQRGPEGGPRATAYVDPQNPAQAILVREYTFFPYGFGMGTLLGGAFGAGMLAGVIAPARNKMAAVALDDSGWQLLLPAEPLRRQYVHAVVCLLGGAAALLVMPAHWILIAGQTGLAAFISGAIALGLVAALAIIAYRRWSVCRHLSDARLRVKPAPMQRGEVFALELGADAYSPLRVRKTLARIMCIEHYQERRGGKTYYGTRTRADKGVELCAETTIPAGEEVAGKGEAVFDRELPPTTDITVKMYPYYTWEIRLVMELEGMVDYTAVFPLEVD